MGMAVSLANTANSWVLQPVKENIVDPACCIFTNSSSSKYRPATEEFTKCGQAALAVLEFMAHGSAASGSFYSSGLNRAFGLVRDLCDASEGLVGLSYLLNPLNTEEGDGPIPGKGGFCQDYSREKFNSLVSKSTALVGGLLALDGIVTSLNIGARLASSFGSNTVFTRAFKGAGSGHARSLIVGTAFLLDIANTYFTSSNTKDKCFSVAQRSAVLGVIGHSYVSDRSKWTKQDHALEALCRLTDAGVSVRQYFQGYKADEHSKIREKLRERQENKAPGFAWGDRRTEKGSSASVESRSLALDEGVEVVVSKPSEEKACPSDFINSETKKAYDDDKSYIVHHLFEDSILRYPASVVNGLVYLVSLPFIRGIEVSESFLKFTSTLLKASSKLGIEEVPQSAALIEVAEKVSAFKKLLMPGKNLSMISGEKGNPYAGLLDAFDKAKEKDGISAGVYVVSMKIFSFLGGLSEFFRGTEAFGYRASLVSDEFGDGRFSNLLKSVGLSSLSDAMSFVGALSLTDKAVDSFKKFYGDKSKSAAIDDFISFGRFSAKATMAFNAVWMPKGELKHWVTVVGTLANSGLCILSEARNEWNGGGKKCGDREYAVIPAASLESAALIGHRQQMLA